jgi:hypothetical protein
MFFDFNKRVYNHVPGECSYVTGTNRGVVDVHLINNFTLIMSTVSLISLKSAANQEKRDIFPLGKESAKKCRKLSKKEIFFPSKCFCCSLNV